MRLGFVPRRARGTFTISVWLTNTLLRDENKDRVTIDITTSAGVLVDGL
ncbi:MAG: hypothetical protein IID42_01975 [Planctomycetes bacterium]|nr:hypothetical protein [Planctomycetota bacterium]